MKKRTFTYLSKLCGVFALANIAIAASAQTVTVGIETPLTNGEVNREVITTFKGVVTSTDNTFIENADITWESSINGLISNKLMFTAGNILSNGVHWLKLTVKKGNLVKKDSSLIYVYGSIPTLFTKEMPIGQVNVNYSKTLYGKSFGPRFTHSIASGALPDGLTLAANTGEIKGKPTKAGNFNFSILVTNANGSESKNLSIYITPEGQYNGMVREYFTGITSGTIDGLLTNVNYPTSPSAVELISESETGNYWSDNYGSRLSGYVIAPITGIYKFALASDDQGQLFLSTDCKAANKVKIASCSTSVKKGLFTATTEQVSAGITLQAGKVYYIEALQVDGRYEDFIQIAWLRPGSNDTITIPAKNLLSSYAGSDCVAPIMIDDVTAPTAPTNLAFANAGSSYISVTWTASTDNKAVKGYEIMVNGKKVGLTMGAANTAYTATGLIPNTGYKITVKAVDLDGNKSALSNELSAKTTFPDMIVPATVSNVMVKSTTVTSATITFDKATDNIGVVKYTILVNDTEVGETIGTTNNLEFLITKLVPNTAYNVKIIATDAAGNKSIASNVVVAKTLADVTPPVAPTNLVDLLVGDTEISLIWDKSVDNVATTSYQLYINNQATPIATSDEPLANVTNLLPGTIYSFKVVAIDAAGNKSPFSEPLIVTTTGVNGTDDANNSLHSISIFPNPSENMIYIKGLNDGISSTISIQNQLGKVIQTGSGNSMNIENLVDGSYLIVIEQDKKKTTKHFLKK